MHSIVQALISGIVLGGVYALLSAGMALVFGSLKIVNFAQGEFIMIGLYIAYITSTDLHLAPYAAVVPTLVVVGLCGYGFARGVLGRLPRAHSDAQLIITLGLSYALQGAASLIMGVNPKTVQLSISTRDVHLGSFQASAALLIAGCGGVLILLLLWAVLYRTRYGVALRALSSNPNAAACFGVNVRRLESAGFALGVGITALGGVLLSPAVAIQPAAGQDYVIVMFLAVVMGGLGSVGGAVLASCVFGIVASLSELALPLSLQPTVAYAMFIAVLIVRPQGIFGVRARV